MIYETIFYHQIVCNLAKMFCTVCNISFDDVDFPVVLSIHLSLQSSAIFIGQKVQQLAASGETSWV